MPNNASPLRATGGSPVVASPNVFVNGSPQLMGVGVPAGMASGGDVQSEFDAMSGFATSAVPNRGLTPSTLFQNPNAGAIASALADLADLNAPGGYLDQFYQKVYNPASGTVDANSKQFLNFLGYNQKPGTTIPVTRVYHPESNLTWIYGPNVRQTLYYADFLNSILWNTNIMSGATPTDQNSGNLIVINSTYPQPDGSTITTTNDPTQAPGYAGFLPTCPTLADLVVHSMTLQGQFGQVANVNPIQNYTSFVGYLYGSTYTGSQDISEPSALAALSMSPTIARCQEWARFMAMEAAERGTCDYFSLTQGNTSDFTQPDGYLASIINAYNSVFANSVDALYGLNGRLQGSPFSANPGAAAYGLVNGSDALQAVLQSCCQPGVAAKLISNFNDMST